MQSVLVNNKDGVRVVHPLIHFLRHLREKKRDNSTSTVSTLQVYPVDTRTGGLHGSLVMTIPRSDRVSTDNGWKSVPLANVNCVNLNRFRLKRLIPIEHDLRVAGDLSKLIQAFLRKDPWKTFSASSECTNWVSVDQKAKLFWPQSHSILPEIRTY